MEHIATTSSVLSQLGLTTSEAEGRGDGAGGPGAPPGQPLSPREMSAAAHNAGGGLMSLFSSALFSGTASGKRIVAPHMLLLGGHEVPTVPLDQVCQILLQVAGRFRVLLRCCNRETFSV